MVKNYINKKQDFKIALGFVMKSVEIFEAIICSRSMKFACFFHQFIDKSKRKLDNISWIDENCFPCEKLTMILIQCNLWEVLTTEFFLIEYQLFGIFLRSTYYQKCYFTKWITTRHKSIFITFLCSNFFGYYLFLATLQNVTPLWHACTYGSCVSMIHGFT